MMEPLIELALDECKRKKTNATPTSQATVIKRRRCLVVSTIAVNNQRKMTHRAESHGQEGGLAPACVEWHSASGGKPPFPTCEIPQVELFLLQSATHISCCYGQLITHANAALFRRSLRQACGRDNR